jgi:N utilization substance protein A
VSIVDDHERVMEVVVEDKQLSLAIGKKGQNVRLAAKLTGWRIDIKSEEEKRREVEAQFGALELGEGETETADTAWSGEGSAEGTGEPVAVAAADEGQEGDQEAPAANDGDDTAGGEQQQ